MAPEAIVLAGSALGRISPKSNRIAGDVREGDLVVIVAGSPPGTAGSTNAMRVHRIGDLSPLPAT